MKLIAYISLLIFTALSFGQGEPDDGSELIKKSKKIQFEEEIAEPVIDNRYKTLELRYAKLESASQASILVDDKTYKCFPDKQSAVRYYFAVKKSAAKTVIYYINNFDDKPTEKITFRVD